MIDAKQAFIEWYQNQTNESLVTLKNSLGLCSHLGCTEDARITWHHQKWCKNHYDIVTGE